MEFIIDLPVPRRRAFAQDGNMAEDGAVRNAVVPGDRVSIVVIAARSV
jgi:hypothetical protein